MAEGPVLKKQLNYHVGDRNVKPIKHVTRRPP